MIPRLQHGFPLLELLVGIGIVVVLMALTLPLLFRAKGDAVITVCLSNMRQLGIATDSYGTENDGFLPWNGERWGQGSRWWKSEVAFSTGLDCPSRTEADQGKFGRLGYNIPISNWTEPKYLAGVDFPGIRVPDFATRLSLIAFPAKKIQVFEPTPWHFEGQTWSPVGVPKDEIGVRIHAPDNRSPISFMDGHALRYDYTTVRDGWYPGTSKVWESAIHGTPKGYRGRDIE